MNPYLSELDQYITASSSAFSVMLANIVNVPTVSADPEHTEDIIRGVTMVAKYLTEFGFKARIIQTKGNPIVYGEFIQDAEFPTVLLYNHLDVQPATAEDWATDPFVCTEQLDKYYGRGTTDDKGPALTALFAARYAVEHKIPLNIKIAWEFEEEIGSPHFEDFLINEATALTADSVMISDSVWLSPEQPAVSYGLRGLITFEISLRTAEHDTHSGLTGGAARNPYGELCQIISKCYDATTGKVKIPGFYDAVVPASESEIDDFLASGFSVGGFAAAHGLQNMHSNDPRTVVSRIMSEPTLKVHGITGGYDGPGVKTVIPAQATAKLSARLVANQNPEAIFALIKSFIQKDHPDAHVTLVASAEPYISEFAGAYANAARQASLTAFGKQPAFVREGGSIGAVVSMHRILNIPVILLALSLPEHGYHAVNEYYDWGQASKGMKFFVQYFLEIASLGTSRSAKPNISS